ncbi:MAG: hypothetical protein N2C14_30405 [Planctomycetales bacterium]
MTFRSAFAVSLWLLTATAWSETAAPTFDPDKDLISLHYDHAPDKDDGHSAAADRTVLEAMFGKDWIKKHVLPVSGAYGKNKGRFNPKSDAVMKAAWNSCGGWRSAHRDWTAAVKEVAERWAAVLKAGGDVWVKEGGQSDLTADVVRNIKRELPGVDARKRIHVIQHSKWNEGQTSSEDLEYTKKNTHYVKIQDANRYLNLKGGDAGFVKAATGHSTFGEVWKAAFAYYDPNHRLDFSDTGELLYILGLGEIGVVDFQKQFLSNPK